jgi:hypothetical protein
MPIKTTKFDQEKANLRNKLKLRQGDLEVLQDD